MRCLYVLYDERCGLCTSVRDWLTRQPAIVPLSLIPAGSPDAKTLFPGLSSGELAVVSDEGAVWVGNTAWIMCLWALHEFRGWANYLSKPAFLPLARQAFEFLSKNRSNLSRVLGLYASPEK